VEWNLKNLEYGGLVFDGLRRSAALNARASGVAEGVTMKMGEGKSRSAFGRYAIVAESDMADAIKREEALRAQFGRERSEIASQQAQVDVSETYRKVQ
jgi:23S rRNA G2445 N2-methylase RlmL